MTLTQKTAIIFIGIIESVILVYASFFLYLASVWIESDSFAFNAQEIDWWIEAGKRFAIGTSISFIVSVLIWLVNHTIVTVMSNKNNRIASWSGKVFFGITIMSSLVGAINFAIIKPYI